MEKVKVYLSFLVISMLILGISVGCGSCGSCICNSCSSCVKGTANCITCGACTACENSCNACDKCVDNTGRGISSIGKGIGKGIEAGVNAGVDAGKDCGGCAGCVGCYCEKVPDSEGNKELVAMCTICGGTYTHEDGTHFISCCGSDCFGCGNGYFHCLSCGTE